VKIYNKGLSRKMKLLFDTAISTKGCNTYKKKLRLSFSALLKPEDHLIRIR
jgi:hypothetical protein